MEKDQLSMGKNAGLRELLLNQPGMGRALTRGHRFCSGSYKYETESRAHGTGRQEWAGMEVCLSRALKAEESRNTGSKNNSVLFKDNVAH